MTDAIVISYYTILLSATIIIMRKHQR